MSKIVLLSCTKSKLDKPAQAQDLYSASPMFKKTLEYSKTLKPDKTFILSAKHYLVPLTKILKPYDKTLKNMSWEEKEEWAKEVIQQMKQNHLNLEKDQFIFLAGSEYINPLKPYITNIENPMVGKKLGERLKWLNTQLQNLKEILYNIKKLIHEYFTR